jgi:endonuclease/exonuclease/phosphatase family metal-dependent hydrolase
MSSAVYSRFVGSSQSSILLRSPLRQWEMRLPVRLNARPWIRILNPAIMAALIILLGVTVVRQGFAETDYVRFSKPDLLTFEELVALEQEDPPSDALAAKLEHLLATPVVSNEAYLGGAKPKRPSSPQLGPFLRAICWNIERGIQFDAIRIALSEPEKFNQVLAEKKDPKAKPLTPEQLKLVKEQLDILQPADLLILNEVDYGVTRTDYRDVARDLAKALRMNYAYGVEFLELDPLNLGLEKVVMEDKEAQTDIQKSFDVDKSRYLGMHGTAVLSRYPIRKATLRPLPVCYDWYASEKKEISKLEAGRRKGANLAFMERMAREIRRGGRTVLFVEIAVPESPTGAVTIVAPHLENKCKPGCRAKQAAQILEWIHADHNPIILGGDLNTTGTDNAPVSVSKVLTDRIKDPDKWAIQAVKWSTGAPTVLLMPVNMMRNKNDPTGFDVRGLSRKKEAKLFDESGKFRFDDGYVFDFRGESERSTEGRGGTLSDSNQRSGKGFRYTFALAKTYGGLFGEYKLDWFFVKGFATDSRKPGAKYQFAPHFARSLMELNYAPEEELSDHVPLTVDLPLTEPPPVGATTP